MTRHLLLASMLSLSLPAFATTLDDCRRIEDDARRLGCYDLLAATASPSLPATAPVANAAPATAGEAPQPGLKTATALPSMLGHAWELDPDERGHILRIRPYKPVYALPLFHTTNPNHAPTSPSAGHTSPGTDLSTTEAKLQISLKSKLMEDVFGDNGDLWFGYTQSSRWQVYNPGDSRPFRETNHEPEAMLVWRTDYALGNWRARYLSLGINHQSNGRSLPLSRSWNRVIASTALENEDWTATLRGWWRIPESAAQDDNPDISAYLGRADLQLVRRWGKQQLSVLLRHNLQFTHDSRGAVQLDYAFPLAGELRGHLQWFSGYGESMIDYNHRANYYGIGVSLLEWY
jgi:phospholipase A1